MLTLKKSWWRRIAQNWVVTLTARIALVLLALVCGWILSYAQSFDRRLVAVNDRIVRIEAVGVTNIPGMASDIDTLQDQMEAQEVRGDAAREDRQRQLDLLDKIVSQQTELLKEQAAQAATLRGIDNRLIRIENKG